jgi:Transposase DDE domain group 1
VRRRKAELRARVNGPLTLRYERAGLTSYAGLDFVRRWLQRDGWIALVRRELATTLPPTDYGVLGLVLVIVALLLSGGRRLRHLRYLERDPIVLRFCGLRHLPTARTVGRWLAGFRAAHLPRLQWVNALVAARAIRQTGQRRLTIDVDGSVVSTGLQVAWAQRGYNPHRRKVPSYYPITAYEAQSGQVLRVQNRPGDIHDGKAALPFLRALLHQVRATLGRGYALEFRMDGAFFRRDVLGLLARAGAEYAIKVPFYPWVGLREKVRQTRTWTRVTDRVSCAEHEVAVATWGGQCFRVVVYRTHVAHETAKNFQLDLFDPSDGHYEYSAVVTNKALGGPALWAFMAGRGTHEKVYGELKSGFAFACVPTMQYAANSAWQCLSVLAFNLSRGFQLATTAPRRAPSRKRWALFAFETIHTLRALCFQRAGVLVQPQGRATLDVGSAPAIAERFKRLDRLLAA